MSTPIFLGYDRVALDREYNNRDKIPDFSRYRARADEGARRARAELPGRLDVAYGPHPGETLDLFFPSASAAAAPIHVFIHGGYWHQRDKADVTFVARGILPGGTIVAVINYALMPTVTLAELVRQCRASIGWLYRNAASFGGDPDRITVSGHSAGGHLVTMLLATDWAAFGQLGGHDMAPQTPQRSERPGEPVALLDPLPADVVKAGCGLSGLYDLEPIRLCYLNDILGLTAEDAHRHSPIHLVPKHASPLLLAVGDDEGPEYHRQMDAMAEAWRRAGGEVEVLDLAGHNHSTILWELSDPSTPLTRAIQAQIATGQRG